MESTLVDPLFLPEQEDHRLTSDNAAMIVRRTQLLGSVYRLFYDKPVHIVRGEGVWLYYSDVRGSGFFKSVELVTDCESREPATELAARVINGLRNRQVLAGTIGKDANILKLRPPMVFTKENADHFLNILDDVLGTT